MPADPHVSAFILYQLGDNPSFRETVRFPRRGGVV
jgi:hypothetical protein